jgi:hypothetical protein
MALTPNEDEELRRIHVLSRFGTLPDTMYARFSELRARDVHAEIPEPTLDVQWIPTQRNPDEAIDDLLDAHADHDDAVDDGETLVDELADFDWVLVRSA